MRKTRGIGRSGATHAARLALVAFAGASLAACASVGPEYSTRSPPAARAAGPKGYKTGAPYQVGGIWYFPREQPNYDKTGIASWYGDAFDQKPTADGEIFDKNIASAAHKTLPLPSLVEVTNLDNGRKLIVRVNDRGPFVAGRIIDLSHEAARELGYDRAGLAHVRVRYVGPAPLYNEDTRRYVRYQPPRTPAPLQPRSAQPPAVSQPSDVVLTSAPLPRAAAPVEVSALAPLPPAASPPPPQAATALSPAPIPVQSSPPEGAGFRVQAGAFASQENARRAVAMLAGAGPASMEPISHYGTTLWRVTLAAADEDQAEALRAKAAAVGFPDARVIAPF